jgi:hypothetical protein
VLKVDEPPCHGRRRTDGPDRFRRSPGPPSPWTAPTGTAERPGIGVPGSSRDVPPVRIRDRRTFESMNSTPASSKRDWVDLQVLYPLSPFFLQSHSFPGGPFVKR